MKIKCIVSGVDANGEPELFFIVIKCNERQYNEGLHYKAAMEQAEIEGYEPKLAYDETDRAGKAMLGLFNWETASVLSV